MANNVMISTADTVWTTTANWSIGTAPVNTNDVYMNAANSVISMLTGLAQSAVTLNSLNPDQSYTGYVGTPTTYLNIGSTTTNIGGPAIGGGNGSRRMNLQLANSGAIVNVWSTANSGVDTGFAPVRLLLTAGVLNVTGGSVCVALAAGETSSIATLKMSATTGTPTVTLGAGVTTTTATINAGSLYSNSANTTTTATIANNGELIHNGTGGYTTLTIKANCTGTHNGTGTVATLNLTGTWDLSGGTGAITVTNCNIYKGAKIIDPGKRITFTNPYVLVNCRETDVSINLGYDRSYAVT